MCKAYLTERWAARFVTELFRSYTVCFVGYSLNDPVLRYMMDALAADRLLGEKPTEAFAFGSYAKGKYEEAENEWKAKNVTPILYANYHRHAYLHRTLQAWAEAYRDGARGKVAIVTRYGLTKPTGSTVQDDYVGRMLWALADASGVPARHFSELDPVPSLDWLEPLSERRFGHDDLPRFGVSPRPKHDEKLSFSLIARPTPYNRAPWMSLFSAGGATEHPWDEVLVRLASWLVRHMGNPKLLHWTVAGGRPTGIFKALLERRLRSAPPADALSVLWQLVLDGRVHHHGLIHGLYEWRAEFAKFGLTSVLRRRLLRLLEPMVQLAEPLLIEEPREHDPEMACKIADLVHWDIVLASDSVHYFLQEWARDESWRAILPELLSDFTGLLHEALRLMQLLEGADHHHDDSYLHQPSIEAHAQNNDFRDWTVLIDLTRDAWLGCVHHDPEQARAEALRWSRISYPLFRRLLFFAGATAPHLFPHSWLFERLFDDGCWGIWSVEVRREAMQFLSVLVHDLSAEEQERLQDAILSGPLPGIYRDDLEPDRLSYP